MTDCLAYIDLFILPSLITAPTGSMLQAAFSVNDILRGFADRVKDPLQYRGTIPLVPIDPHFACLHVKHFK